MKINKTLVIVESPTKSNKIQEYLGENFIVKSTKGHILELASGGKYGIGIDINNNFNPKYLIINDKIEILQELMNIASKTKEVILATDNDREGLAIARHLYERLKEYNVSFKRITFSEITKKAILQSISNYEDILSIDNINMYNAQMARRILDRIVGFSASPFLMNYFGKGLSAGRVQSVLVKMIVDREQEIEIFNPETYFTIQAKLAKDNKSFITKYCEKIIDQDIANKTKKELEDNGSKYLVIKIDEAEEKKKPLPPLITATLQQVMSKKYKISSERTMKAAQILYEQSYITYIRTDSIHISEEAISMVRSWLRDNNYDIPKSKNIYKSKTTTHECIRPVDITNTPDTINLMGDEKQVYEVIWKYFVSSQMKPAIYNTLKVIIEQTNTKHKVVASGKALVYKGFLEILGTTDDNVIDIPNLVIGDEVKLFGDKPITLEKKQTQPPPRYSEANLIKTLEEKEIGRPSTYATLLSTITARNYVEQKGSVFHPTELGKQITAELVKWFSFLEYNYTSLLEKKLDDIADGKVEYITMLNEFYTIFSEELKKAYINHGAKPCKKCNGMMREITAKKGDKFFGCSNYPSCKATESIKTIKTSAPLDI